MSKPEHATEKPKKPFFRRRLVVAVVLVLAAFLAASSVLFVWPASDIPSHVDGILSLNGGDERARENLAIHLAESGYAPVLLFSQGETPTPCPRLHRIKVVCFMASPERTVGEVSFAAEYAKRHGWHSLIVVPGRTQTTRARLLMQRCFTGRVVMVPASVQLDQIPYDVVYEWGALAKALLVDRHC